MIGGGGGSRDCAALQAALERLDRLSSAQRVHSLTHRRITRGGSRPITPRPDHPAPKKVAETQLFDGLPQLFPVARSDIRGIGPRQSPPPQEHTPMTARMKASILATATLLLALGPLRPRNPRRPEQLRMPRPPRPHGLPLPQPQRDEEVLQQKPALRAVRPVRSSQQLITQPRQTRVKGAGDIGAYQRQAGVGRRWPVVLTSRRIWQRGFRDVGARDGERVNAARAAPSHPAGAAAHSGDREPARLQTFRPRNTTGVLFFARAGTTLKFWFAQQQPRIHRARDARQRAQQRRDDMIR